MKKIFVACTLVIGLSALGATNASASVCLQLVNFCDKMQLDGDSSANVYGYWDWTCGCTLARVLGNHKPGEVISTGLLVEIALTESWRIHPSSSTVDIWKYDGFNPPSLLVPANQPFTVTSGSCGCLNASDKPSVNGAN